MFSTFPIRIKRVEGQSYLQIDRQQPQSFLSQQFDKAIEWNVDLADPLYTYTAFRIVPVSGSNKWQLLYFMTPPMGMSANDFNEAFKCCPNDQCTRDSTCGAALALGKDKDSNRAVLRAPSETSTHFQLVRGECVHYGKYSTVAFRFDNEEYLRVVDGQFYIEPVDNAKFKQDACFELLEMQNAIFKPDDLTRLMFAETPEGFLVIPPSNETPYDFEMRQGVVSGLGGGGEGAADEGSISSVCVVDSDCPLRDVCKNGQCIPSWKSEETPPEEPKFMDHVPWLIALGLAILLAILGGIAYASGSRAPVTVQK